MAIRKRGNSYHVYWNNPLTGRREGETYHSLEEAEKADSLIQHCLRFDYESFMETEQASDKTTLEQVYFQYLCENRFSKHALGLHRGLMRYALETFGRNQ